MYKEVVVGFTRIKTADGWHLVADVGILEGDDLDVMKELLRRIELVKGVTADYLGERVRIKFYPSHFMFVPGRDR